MNRKVFMKSHKSSLKTALISASLGVAMSTVAFLSTALPVAAGSISENMAQLSYLGESLEATTAMESAHASAASVMEAKEPVISEISSADLALVSGETSQIQTGGTTKVQTQEGGVELVDVSLSNNYNDTYKLYELGINNRWYFYSTVDNGGMTSDPVKMDIPKNISYAVEKDGAGIAYTSGKEIKALGTYVFTVWVQDGNTVYRSFFRFRIMEPVEEENTEEETSTQGESQGEEGTAGVEDQTAATEGESTTAVDFGDGSQYEDLTEEEIAALEKAIENGEEDDILNPDGTLNQEALDALAREALGDSELPHTEEGISEATGLSSGYDASTGYYRHDLKNGMCFYTDVPNGMITNSKVTLLTRDDLNFSIYRDGEAIEYKEGDGIYEEGSYTVVISAEDVIFYEAYQDRLPEFHFRIIENPVRDLSIVNAPEGFTIREVWKDDMTADGIKMIGDKAVWLREDGKYTIAFSSDIADIETQFTLDRTSSRFEVFTEKNLAQLGFYSEDQSRCVIYRNGDLYQERDDVLYKITQAGEYDYYVFDVAGNMSYAHFTVKYGMNLGAIIAILAVVLMGIGIYVYVRWLNRHVRVR